MYAVEKQIGERGREDVMCPGVNQVEQAAACVHDASGGEQVWDQWLPNKTAWGFIATPLDKICLAGFRLMSRDMIRFFFWRGDILKWLSCIIISPRHVIVLQRYNT